MHKLIITEAAKRDIQSTFEWWQDHRSSQQAERWYRSIYQAIVALRTDHERCPLALEADLLTYQMRQLLFGVGRRMTHRIVFTVADEVVTVLRIRHTSQGYLTLDDLT